MDKDNMCRMPLQATMSKQPDGSYKIVENDFTKWYDVPADLVARFLIEKHGITPILKGGDNA